MAEFVERYGPWAVVAGASEGIGASFSQKLAGRGMNLVLVARRAAPLEELATQLRQKHGVEVKVQPLDVSSPDAVAAMSAATEGLDIGLMIYNAAYSPIGAFLDIDVEEHLKPLLRAAVRRAREGRNHPDVIHERLSGHGHGGQLCGDQGLRHGPG
ncbi:MAG: SDR family NAD(P)-dependent oxidoreductase [Deltaproteobacteria bacterium]|nr:SDR family NAD(P)-dependent oxidoreductase [Deltaproteobacteria bacterium]